MPSSLQGQYSTCRDDVGNRRAARVALVTTHIPLAYVSQAVTEDRLEPSLLFCIKIWSKKFAIEKPTIYVCGLNPHAGEDGCLGREEIGNCFHL
ncbi:4-hydroxythreonine-4-phosphate dehydrogenase PdxA [Vibrio lentus]|nr:4-hydroxythreonine-4-phosphate dehydrogenase PdxA [Vibrio lentus]